MSTFYNLHTRHRARRREVRELRKENERLKAENEKLRSAISNKKSLSIEEHKATQEAIKIANMRGDEVKELDFGNVFWACGVLATALSQPKQVDVDRIKQLEAENERLREGLEQIINHPATTTTLHDVINIAKNLIGEESE